MPTIIRFWVHKDSDFKSKNIKTDPGIVHSFNLCW